MVRPLCEEAASVEGVAIVKTNDVLIINNNFTRWIITSQFRIWLFAQKDIAQRKLTLIKC